MKCKDYQKWIHLFREGELTSSQAAKLERHVRICSSCKAQKHEVEKMSQLIHVVRKTELQPSNAEGLTNSIMDAIEPPLYTRGVSPYEGETHSWYDWLYFPKIRLVVTAVAIILLGIFLFQGTMILNHIRSLEKKIAGQQGNQVAIESVLSKQITRARISYILDQADLIYRNLPGDNDRIVIRKSTLRRLLWLLIKSWKSDDKLSHQLLLHISHLFDINIENGIEKKELKKIMEKKKEILKNI